jgi:prepilin peptidase CpaA
MATEFILYTLALLYGAVILYDARRYVIPNWLNFAIGALYVVYFALVLPQPWWGGVAACGAMFVAGFLLFTLGIMGGGDVKLLTVSMLWTGWSVLSLQFLFATAIAGGVLAIALILLRRIILLFKWRNAPRIFMRGQPIPYGIAIALGFLWVRLPWVIGL